MAPCPGLNSIHEITVPKGTFFNFMAFPTLGSADSEEITFWSTLIPLGAMMYLFSPSAYSRSAINAVLFGSYSTDFTVASTSRSEEHTSELQSRENLVCRLLLEKKKKT